MSAPDTSRMSPGNSSVPSSHAFGLGKTLRRQHSSAPARPSPASRPHYRLSILQLIGVKVLLLLSISMGLCLGTSLTSFLSERTRQRTVFQPSRVIYFCIGIVICALIGNVYQLELSPSLRDAWLLREVHVGTESLAIESWLVPAISPRIEWISRRLECGGSSLFGVSGTKAK